jgi:hypothetical protein
VEAAVPLAYEMLAVKTAPRWKRIAHRLAVVGVIAFSIFASLQAMALTSPKVHIVRINLNAQVTDKVNFINTTMDARPDERGVVYVDLLGTSDLPSASRLNLMIYPATVPNGFAQPWCCEIAKNTFYGKIQLGSEQYPVKKDELYSFEMKLAPADVLVGKGTIKAEVEELTEQNKSTQTIMGGVGLLAALLQIFFLLIPHTLSFKAYNESVDENSQSA